MSWARWVAWWLLRLLSWSKLNVNAHSPVFTAYLEHEHGPADDLWTIRPVGWTLELLNLDIITYQLNTFMLEIYRGSSWYVFKVPCSLHPFFWVVFQSLMFIYAIVQSEYFLLEMKAITAAFREYWCQNCETLADTIVTANLYNQDKNIYCVDLNIRRYVSRRDKENL